MHDHFRKIGERGARNIRFEDKYAKDILATLRKRLGSGGHFLKKSNVSHDLYEVEEDKALQKVLKDLKQRNKRIEKWFQEELELVKGTETRVLQTLSSAERIVPSPFSQVEEHHFILSWYNGEYTVRKSTTLVYSGRVLPLIFVQDIMHDYFRKIGVRPTSKEDCRVHRRTEEKIRNEIFGTFKSKLGIGGHFLKKSALSHDLIEIEDDAAMERIDKDLRQRNERIDKWLQNELDKDE